MLEILSDPSGRPSAALLLALMLMSPHVQRQPRLLAIEPDPLRATTLARFLRGYVAADVEIVTSTDDAVRSLAERIPDLMLTSIFLAPAEAAALTAYLKQLPDAAHLQVITIPHFIDVEDPSPDESPKILNFLKRRSALARPTCDPRTVRDQIEHYLERARVDRENRASHRRSGARAAPGAAARTSRPQTPFTCRLTADDVYTLASGIGPRTCTAGRAPARDRRRACRRRSTELAAPVTVKLPCDAEVNVIDISRHGVLLESTAKITAGRTLDLQMLQDGKHLRVPARMVRSEVARVEASGVTYSVAAAFDAELDMTILKR